MNSLVAQVAALACHLNARCRGLPVERMYPGNSTCRSCAFVRFVQMVPRDSRIGDLPECIETPDEWLDALVRNGVSRGRIFYAPRNFPLAVDRLSSFMGDGGDWWIGIERGGQSNYWQPFWRTGHRNAPEKRVWRVQYDETDHEPPMARPEIGVAELSGQLSAALASIEMFASEHQLNHFAARFRKANQSLAADGDCLAAEHYYNDLAPAGSLSLPSRRLLACCEDAWVFGGMGSWNDECFEAEDGRTYCVLSDRLFELVNRAICAAVNESAAEC